MASRARERLDELLEEGGDPLVQKVLNFIEFGSSQQWDEQAPLHRNMRRFGDLQFRELTAIMESWHGLLWAAAVTKRVRLPACRSLVCWAMGVDAGEALPRRHLAALRDVCKLQYEGHSSQTRHRAQPRATMQIASSCFFFIFHQGVDGFWTILSCFRTDRSIGRPRPGQRQFLCVNF